MTARDDIPGGMAGTGEGSIAQRIFETTLDLILVVDSNGEIFRVSPSAYTVLGYRPAEMIGHVASEFILADDLDAIREEMRVARKRGSFRHFECRYHHKDGRIVTLNWTGVWSEPDQHHFFIGRDMTERLDFERKLRQAQRMEAIGQLTGGIAHDFNNLLTVIIGTTEALAGLVAGVPKLAELVRTIDETAERGARLTQRMLAFARNQPLLARPVDLNEAVEQSAEMLRRTLREDIAIETSLADGLWLALADEAQVKDAVLNLAINARDAMPSGGRLAIDTANVHLDNAYAAHNPDVLPGDYVAVIVTDTGSGMPPEVCERAFDPFFTTKEAGDGTGLGLSMIYGFARQSRGHVKIYSELGRGTSVKLYLPRAAAGEHADTDAEAYPPDADVKGTILVVEDDPNVRAVAVSALESLGYTVLEAENGPAGLEIIKGPDEIDLLFTDMIMPHGMTGADLAREARLHRPDLKVLFTSGYSEQFVTDLGELQDTGALLNKPYRKRVLAEAVRQLLGGGA